MDQHITISKSKGPILHTKNKFGIKSEFLHYLNDTVFKNDDPISIADLVE